MNEYKGPDRDIDGDLMDDEWDEHAEGSEQGDPEDWDDWDEPPRRRRTAFEMIVATLVVVGLLSIGLGQTFQFLRMPSLEFLQESRELGRDPFIQGLQQGVVQIQASAGRTGRDIRHGTGFNIEEQGLIVTNRHIIADAQLVAATFRDQGTFYGTDWVLHPSTDLAVIRLAGSNLPTVGLGRTALPRVGETVFVIGNPLGFANTAMQGTIRSYGQLPSRGGAPPVLVMEIIAPIQAGSSGSPVFDRNGSVIGVVFARVPADDDAPDRGLAIPIRELEPLLRNAPPALQHVN